MFTLQCMGQWHFTFLADGPTDRLVRTFPTGFFDYPSTYTVWGTLSTKVGGMPTCLRIPVNSASATGGSVFTLPTHPVLPTQSDFHGADSNNPFAAEQAALDPKGWSFQASSDDVIQGQCDYKPLIQTLIPDLGMWACQTAGVCAVSGSVFHIQSLALMET